MCAKLIDHILRFISIFEKSEFNVFEMNARNGEHDAHYLNTGENVRRLLADIISEYDGANFSIEATDNPNILGYLAKMYIIYLEGDLIKIIVLFDTEVSVHGDYVALLGPTFKRFEGRRFVEFDWGLLFDDHLNGDFTS